MVEFTVVMNALVQVAVQGRSRLAIETTNGPEQIARVRIAVLPAGEAKVAGLLGTHWLNAQRVWGESLPDCVCQLDRRGRDFKHAVRFSVRKLWDREFAIEHGKRRAIFELPGDFRVFHADEVVGQNGESGHLVRCHYNGGRICKIFVRQELWPILYLRRLRRRNAGLVEARLDLVGREGSERHHHEGKANDSSHFRRPGKKDRCHEC
jgi:hypothetical protein